MSEQKSITSYYLFNKSDGYLSLNTELKGEGTGRKRKHVVISLLKDRKEYLIQEQNGYSAKQLYFSPGVQKHIKKGYLRGREHKQLYSAGK